MMTNYYSDFVQKATIIQNEVRSQKKITGLFGNFSHKGEGGLPNSQNFCKLTKCFFACQISLISGGKTEFWEFLGGGSPIPKSKCNKNGKILTFW